MLQNIYQTQPMEVFMKKYTYIVGGGDRDDWLDPIIPGTWPPPGCR